MKKVQKLCMLILLLPVIGVAEENQDFFKFINNQNLFTTPNLCVQPEDETLHQCAVDLCGPPETASLATLNDANFNRFVLPETELEFTLLDDPVKKIFESKKKEMEDFIKNFRNKLNSQEKFLDYLTWDSSTYSFMASAIYDPLIQIQIDKSRPKEKRLNIAINYPKAVSETFKKGLESYAEEKKKKIETSISHGLKNNLYTNEESAILVKDLARVFFENLATEHEKNPDILKDHSKKIKKYADLEKLKLKGYVDFFEAYHELELLNRKLKKGHGDTTRDSEESGCSKVCRMGMRDHFSRMNFHERINQLEKKVQEATLAKALEECRSAYMTRRLQESDRNKFLSSYDDIKESFKKNVMKGFSQHSTLEFEKYLNDELHLSFVDSPSSSAEEFISSLKIKAEAEPASFNDEKASNLIKKLINTQNWYDPETFVPDLSSCQNEGPFIAWDAFIPKDDLSDRHYIFDMKKNSDNLRVSLYSCSHSSQGKGVVSHEIAHALSHAFKRGKLSQDSEVEYNKLRKCADHFYVVPPLSSEDFLSRPGDTIKTEEDTADLIGQIATQEEKTITSCLMLSTNNKGNQYTSLGLETNYGFHPHSHPLLRIIREAVYRKRNLSPACKLIIEKNKHRFRFQPC